MTKRATNLLQTIILMCFLALMLLGMSALRSASQEIVDVDEAGEPVYAQSGEAIVRLKSGVDVNFVNRLIARSGAKIRKRMRQDPAVLQSHPRMLRRCLEVLDENGLLEYAEPNYIAHASYTPNDPFYQYQWNLFSRGKPSGNTVSNYGIQADRAWDISTGQGVVIAILDTGVAYETRGKFVQCPDLAGVSFTQGYNFVNGNRYANDDQGHGTHVAGTIAQRTGNKKGCAGVAFNATIMPIKVLDKKGSGTYSNIVAGILWAVDHGANIINLSLGGPANSQALADAVSYAWSKGVIVVAAAGNANKASCDYPAALPECIAVGATDFAGQKAPYSNYGPDIDVMAPGGNVTADLNGDRTVDGILQMTFVKQPYKMNYYLFAGTSMATPHVSGVAALVMSAHPNYTAAQVRQAIESTCLPIGSSSQYGYGLLDAYGAVTWSP